MHPPSRHPFLHPLNHWAIDHLTHPDPAHPFHRPLIDDDGNLWAGNDFLFLKLLSPRFETAHLPPLLPEHRVCLDQLPWHLTRDPGEPAHWHPLDHVRGLLYRYPPRPIYVRHDRQWLRGPTVPVRIAGAPMVHLSTLQLLARLPRVELNTQYAGHDRPIPFRCTAGIGLITTSCYPDAASCAFRIFTTPSDKLGALPLHRPPPDTSRRPPIPIHRSPDYVDDTWPPPDPGY